MNKLVVIGFALLTATRVSGEDNPPKPVNLSDVFKAVQSKDEGTRIAALHTISEMKPIPESAVDLLIELLRKDTAPVVRMVTADRLGQSARPRALDALLGALKTEKDSEVRTRIVNAIGSFGPNGKKAISALIEIIKDPASCEENPTPCCIGGMFGSSCFACEAAWALKRIGADSVAPLTEVFCDTRNPVPVRLAAGTSLTGFGKDSRTAIKPVIPLFADPNDDIRLQAITVVVMADRQVPEVKRALYGALADSSSVVRIVAAAELFQTDPDNVVSVPVLIRDLDRGTAKDEHYIQWRATVELGRIGETAKPAVPALIKLMESKDRSLRLAATQALGRIGPSAKASIPALRKMELELNRNLHTAATTSIKQILEAK